MMAQQKDGIDRRQLLLGASVAGAAATIPGLGAAGDDTPVMRLYREWAHLRDMAGSPDVDCDGTDLFCDEAYRVLTEMMATPAQSEGDMLRQMFALSAQGEALYYEPDTAGIALAQIASALA